MIKIKKLRRKIIISSLFFSLLGLSFFYLLQMTKMSENAYTIGKKTEIAIELGKETDELKLKISKQKNLKNAEEKILEQGFQKLISGNISYVIIPEISLAKN
jgi:cell division protein YceG involved in septum cleavage